MIGDILKILGHPAVGTALDIVKTGVSIYGENSRARNQSRLYDLEQESKVSRSTPLNDRMYVDMCNELNRRTLELRKQTDAMYQAPASNSLLVPQVPISAPAPALAPNPQVPAAALPGVMSVPVQTPVIFPSYVVQPVYQMGLAYQLVPGYPTVPVVQQMYY